MIEKLDKFDSTEASIYHVERLYAKVNEIIDELNPILEERESGIKVYEEVMSNMKPADPYAEQRKWIGKLCRFWDDDKDCFVFGILDDVDNDYLTSSSRVYFDSESAGWWEHCEPVKPDDDIIYKGGDNE